MTQTERLPLRYIRKNFDWEEYVTLHFSVKETANPSEVRVCCPKCGEQDYKCYINTERKIFNCFKCGFSSSKYDVINFVSLAEGIPKIDAIRRLMAQMEICAPTQEQLAAMMDEQLKGFVPKVDEKALRTAPGMPEAAKMLTSDKDPEQAPFFAYLYSRGLTTAEITNLRVHYVPEEKSLIYRQVAGRAKIAGNIGRRVIWPVYGGDNALVSWISRTIDNSEPKYLNLPDSDLNMTLWPYVLPYNNTAVLVEGILDCYAVRRLERTSAYATFGKHLGKDQIDVLQKWGTETVILMWDKRDAKPEMLSAVEKLKSCFPKVFVASQSNMSHTGDAGDLLKDPDGVQKIQDALKLVDVHSIEYLKWQLS